MEFEKILAALVVALAVNQLAHIVLELWGVRRKVPRYIHTLALHAIIFLLITGLVFGILITIDLSVQSLLTIAITMLVLVYALSSVSLDAYYEQIGKKLKN